MTSGFCWGADLPGGTRTPGKLLGTRITWSCGSAGPGDSGSLHFLQGPSSPWGSQAMLSDKTRRCIFQLCLVLPEGAAQDSHPRGRHYVACHLERLTVLPAGSAPGHLSVGDADPQPGSCSPPSRPESSSLGCEMAGARAPRPSWSIRACGGAGGREPKMEAAALVSAEGCAASWGVLKPSLCALGSRRRNHGATLMGRTGLLKALLPTSSHGQLGFSVHFGGHLQASAWASPCLGLASSSGRPVSMSSPPQHLLWR